MNIKKFICVLSVVFLILSLSSCKATKKYTAEEICDKLVNVVFTSYDKTPLNQKETQNYFSLNTNQLAAQKVVIGTKDESFRIVAALKPINEKARTEIIESINDTVFNSAKLYREFSQNEYKKISSRLLYEKDGIIILVIADDQTSAKKELEKLGATPIT